MINSPAGCRPVLAHMGSTRDQSHDHGLVILATKSLAANFNSLAVYAIGYKWEPLLMQVPFVPFIENTSSHPNFVM